MAPHINSLYCERGEYSISTATDSRISLQSLIDRQVIGILMKVLRRASVVWHTVSIRTGEDC